MKRICILLIAIASLFLLVACGKDKQAITTSAKGSDNTLVMSWPKDIGEVNPHLYSPNEMFTQAMLYDPLVIYENDGTISPGLAASWDMSEDGEVYTFKLRQGVRYSDGSALTAENVKRNFDAVIENSSAHSWLEVVTVIDHVEVIDETTVEVHLKEAYYPFLQELTLIRPLRMLGDAGFPENGSTADGIKAAIGTGPWVLTAYEKDSFAEFTRNEDYWGEKPSIKKVIVKIIADSQARMMALEKGDIDLIFGSAQLAPAEFTTLQQRDEYITKVSAPLSTRILAFNTTYGVTQYKEVRRALQHALDRQTIIEHVLNGLEQEAYSLFAPGFPYSDIEIEKYAFDIEKATSILEEAGWSMDAKTGIRVKNGETLTLTIPYNSNDQVHKAIFEYLQGAWKELGVEVKLIGEESQLLNVRAKAGEYNLIVNDTWGAPYDPHMYIRTMTGEKQIGFYAKEGIESNKKLTDEITRVIRATDEAERQTLYESIIQTIQHEAIFMPISYRQNYLVANDVFKTVSFSPQQYEVPINLFEMK